MSASVQAEAFSPWSAYADVLFHHYGQDDGLPSPVATAVGEDGDGFLWVGTQDGLARWDGYRFKAYKPSAVDPATLPDSSITALFVDAQHLLWVGTSAGGLATYDRSQDRFLPYKAALRGVHVTAIADAGGGDLWIGTDTGLDRLDPRTGRIIRYVHKAGDPGSPPSDLIRSLLRDRDGALWVGTQVGLGRLKAGTSKFETVPLPVADGDATVWSLFQDDSGRIWIGAKKGAFVTLPGDAKPEPIADTSGGYDLKNDWVYAIGAGRPGEVWLGTYGHGVVVVDVASGETRRINHEPSVAHSLGQDTIWVIYRDRAGGVWVGTTGFISRLDSGGALDVISGSGRKRLISETDADSLMADSAGRLWVGLSTKGVDIVDLATHRVRNIPVDRTRPDRALPETYVLSMMQWAKDRVYLSTGAGLYRTDENGRHVARVKVAGRDPGARIYATAAIDGRLWIGGMDDGLWSLDPDAVSSKAARVEHFGAGRLTDARIVSIMPGGRGDLWIGTRNGLNRLRA